MPKVVVVVEFDDPSFERCVELSSPDRWPEIETAAQDCMLNIGVSMTVRLLGAQFGAVGRIQSIPGRADQLIQLQSMPVDVEK